MAFEVSIDRIVDRDSGNLNLAKLFELSEERRLVLAAPPSPARRKAPSYLFPQPKGNTDLVLRGKNPLARVSAKRFPASLKPLFESRSRSGRRPKLPDASAVKVATVTGTGSRALSQFDLHAKGEQTISIPFFLDRYITAAALKQFAGMPEDTLLRSRGKEWEVVQDSEVIDLLDRNVVLCLGTVTMLS